MSTLAEKLKERQKKFLALQELDSDVLTPPKLELDEIGEDGFPIKTEVVEDVNQPTSIRTKMSERGFDLAKQAGSGLIGGDGVVDIPDSASLYSEGGAEVNFPKAVQLAGEYLGDVGLTALGSFDGGWGYLTGGFADLLVKGGMNRSSAYKLAKDIYSIPETFAGSPFILNKLGPSKFRIKNRTEADPKVSETSTVTQTSIALSADEIGTLVKDAASGKKGAIEKLAEVAMVNPEAANAARRLGIELPPDVLSDSVLIQQAAGLTRSAQATDSSSVWVETLRRASDQADLAMEKLGGSTDLSVVSQKVFDDITTSQANLQKLSNELYTGNLQKNIVGINELVPGGSTASANNSVKLINELIADFGGVSALGSKEKLLFNSITNPKVKFTYAKLDQIRQDIGAALQKGSGPYADVSQGSLKRLYAALAKDQLLTVENIGGIDARKQLVLAKQLVAKRKATESRIINLYGKELDGSIASVLRNSIAQGSKGDIGKLNKIIKLIPEDLRRESVATAITSIAQSNRSTEIGFGFAEYAKMYKGLKQNKVVYEKIIKTLGPESRKLLDDFYEISRRVTDARANVLTTGKANQALVNSMVAEGLVQRVMSSSVTGRIVQGSGAGLGAAGGLQMGGAYGAGAGALAGGFLSGYLKMGNKVDRIKAAGELFASDLFKKLAVNPTEANAFIVAKSPAYKRWAKSVGITDPNLWIQGAIVSSISDGGVEPQEMPEPVATENNDDETAINSGALDTIVSTLKQPAIDKILKANENRIN
tara:strand:- start:40 stop:2340 length:2301 start_codon:yes stop_codon:yes gene_type:complete